MTQHRVARATHARSSSPSAGIGRPHRAPRWRSHPVAAPAARRSAPTPRRREVAQRGRTRPRTVPATWRPSSEVVARLDETVDGRTRRGARRGGAARSSSSRASARRSSRSSSTRATASRRRSSTTGRSASSPGVPSAYTQPLYGWFLAAIYLPFGRSWLAVGIAQIVVAVADRARRLRDRDAPALDRRRPRRGARHDAPPVRRLARRPPEPRAARRARPRRCSRSARSRPTSVARSLARGRDGPSPGLAILGNARLVLLPVAIAIYVAWRTPARPRRSPPLRSSSGWLRSWSSPVGRAQQGAGRLLRDHDGRARAVEGEQREHARACSIAAAGSTTCRSFRARRRGRSSAADLTLVAEADERRRVRADAALPPTRSSTSGATSPARRRASPPQATRHALEPRAARVGRERERNSAPRAQDDRARVRGRSLRPGDRRRLRRSAATSSGSPCSCSPTTRSPRWSSPERLAYRAPWDFLLALLAAFALASAWERVQRRRHRHYVGAGSSARA